MSFPARTLSPGFTSLITVAMAAIPLANAKAPSAFSMSAIWFSSSVRVGFPLLE